MAMPELIYSSLKSALNENKVKIGDEEKPLLDVVAGWYDLSEASDKIKTANADLTSQREKWEGSEKDYKTKLKDLEDSKTALETESDKLKESQLTEDERKQWLAIKGKGMTSDVEAKLNAAIQASTEAKQQIDTLTNSLKERDEKLLVEKMTGAEKSLEARMVTELAKHKVEADQAKLAILGMKGGGWVKVDKDDQGNIVEKFRAIRDGKELEASFEGMVETYASQNEFLKRGTQSSGTGQNHNNSGKTSSSDLSPMEMLKL